MKKSEREIMEMLEAFDLTRCAHSAPESTTGWFGDVYSGQTSTPSQRRYSVELRMGPPSPADTGSIVVNSPPRPSC